MAHNITATDRFGFVGEPAWHGLGRKLQPGLTAVAAFEELGLGWRTVLAPITATVPIGNGLPPIEVACSDHRAHIRQDNRAVLGIVSDDYSAVENLDMAAFADAVLGEAPSGINDDGSVGMAPVASIETAGSLLGGRRVFALLRMPQSIALPKGDDMATYLALSNGHGGTASFSCYPTAIRIVCANTLRMSERDLTRGVRFMHTGDLEGKLRTAKLALGFATKELGKLEEQAKAMAARSLSIGQAGDYFACVFDATFPAPVSDDATVAKRWNDKRTETINRWIELFQNERNAGRFGANAWTAYNAVSEWHEHERGRFGAVADSEGRVHSNLFGVSHVAKGKAFRQALSLV